LTESLRLNTDSAPTHYNLGLAYSMLREFAAATREYEAAIGLDPNHAEAHNNLGAMLHVAGRLDQAATHYRLALELRPENAEARGNFGRLLTMQGKTAEAAQQFEAGLAAQPESVASLTGLAWIRATAASASLRRPGQAVALAERARQLTRGQDPQVFDALAAGYAALNDFANALVAIKAGVRAAASNGQSMLVAAMLERQRLYEQQKPFVQ
jgi:tetratricopeptide (TPR) repeat protein